MLFVFFGGVLTSVAEYWITGAWWLNSGRGVAAMLVALALAGLVVGAIFGRDARHWARAAGFFAAGAFCGQAAVLFAIGPGTIFPIALFFCAALTSFGVAVGSSLGFALARALR
jgi:hypothetical protein